MKRFLLLFGFLALSLLTSFTARAESGESILVIAEVGSGTFLKPADLPGFLGSILANSADSPVDLLIVGSGDCRYCEPYGLAESSDHVYPVVDVQRKSAAERQAIWDDLSASVASRGARPSSLLNKLPDLISAYAKRRAAYNKSVLLVTAGPVVRQTTDAILPSERRPNDYSALPGVSSGASTEEIALAQRVGEIAETAKIRIHVLQTPRLAEMQVHVDPSGTCRWVMETFAVRTERSTLARLAQATGGSYSDLARLLESPAGNAPAPAFVEISAAQIAQIGQALGLTAAQRTSLARGGQLSAAQIDALVWGGQLTRAERDSLLAGGGLDETLLEELVVSGAITAAQRNSLKNGGQLTTAQIAALIASGKLTSSQRNFFEAQAAVSFGEGVIPASQLASLLGRTRGNGAGLAELVAYARWVQRIMGEIVAGPGSVKPNVSLEIEAAPEKPKARPEAKPAIKP